MTTGKEKVLKQQKNNLKIIYAIPGLGTTKELFNSISVPGYQIKVLDWPTPQPAWNLKDYAREFLKQIDSSGPINLLGVSFGGMLCCELADLVTVEKLVLVSSCKNRRELPGILRLLRFFPAHLLFSDRHYRSLAARSRWVIGFEKSYMPEYMKMVHAMPHNYFIRCFHMIVSWNRISNSQNIVHLHGNADRLLLYKNIKNCETIKKGTHAMIVYQAKEINDFLNRAFNGL